MSRQRRPLIYRLPFGLWKRQLQRRAFGIRPVVDKNADYSPPPRSTVSVDV